MKRIAGALLGTIAGMAAIAVAGPACAAEAGPSRTPEQIVCELTGDCTGVPAATARRIRPDEAAFSLTRSGGTAKPAAAPARTAPMAATAPASNRRTRPMRAAGIDMRISFALDSAEMTPQGREEAAQFAKAMALPALAGRKFVVAGHTDMIGSREHNLDRSRRRAAAVAAYLASLGVPAERLEPVGYGFDHPLPGTAMRAPANRRVQFVPA